MVREDELIDKIFGSLYLFISFMLILMKNHVAWFLAGDETEVDYVNMFH